MNSKSKSPRPWKVADSHFPVRVRVPTPPRGFGQQLDAMHHWLHQRVGLSRFYQWGERGTVGSETLLLYLDDLDVAREFVMQFDCALLVQGQWSR